MPFPFWLSYRILQIPIAKRILRVVCSKLRLNGDFEYTQLVKLTPGYVGADLGALAAEAGLIAVKRIYDELLEDGGGDGTGRRAYGGVNDMDEDGLEETVGDGSDWRTLMGQT